MAAFAWGRQLRAGAVVVGATRAGASDRPPSTCNDDERLAFDRLGPAEWWKWVRRGQWDPPQSWEVEW